MFETSTYLLLECKNFLFQNTLNIKKIMFKMTIFVVQKMYAGNCFVTLIKVER